MIKEIAPLVQKGMRVSIQIEGSENGAIRVLLLVSGRKKLNIPDFKPLVRVLSGSDYQEIERRLSDQQTLSLLSERMQIIDVSFQNESKKPIETPKASDIPANAATTKRGRPKTTRTETSVNSVVETPTIEVKTETAQISLIDEIENAPPVQPKVIEAPFIKDLRGHLTEMDANLVLGDSDGLAKWLELAKELKTKFAAHLEDPEFKRVLDELYPKQKEEYLKKTKA